jgi:hypothetical protein
MAHEISQAWFERTQLRGVQHIERDTVPLHVGTPAGGALERRVLAVDMQVTRMADQIRRADGFGQIQPRATRALVECLGRVDDRRQLLRAARPQEPP